MNCYSLVYGTAGVDWLAIRKPLQKASNCRRLDPVSAKYGCMILRGIWALRYKERFADVPQTFQDGFLFFRSGSPFPHGVSSEF